MNVLGALGATLLGGFFLPWWWPALVGSLLAFWKPKAILPNTLAGFLGGAMAWGLLAAYFNFGNYNLLADRVAGLFQIRSGWWMVAVTAALGGSTAALGVWWSGWLYSTKRA